ncbi:Zinc carboxypeptidase [Flavobacteriaceae bacterium MAR_2010_188]|nr:Zinc carboxypeptidase [Flavobacteriaceae bacterium MAR_2010_188]
MKSFLFVLTLYFFSLSPTFSQSITSPSDFLGYEIGTQFSRHSQVVDYFKEVAEEMPNQVKLVNYGETYERRPLYVAYVSSEENMRNIETIRENNLKRAGLLDGSPSSNEVAIVWLSYNVHGNEASSTEASMNTLYKLLTEKQEWLKNVLVIIDPCINPDGRDRYANWYNETKSTPYDTDPQASEHNEPWPGGRPNHYLFDLNRDWAWATQIESQSRLKIYNKWLPQVHVDFHEQGINAPYYFAPAAEPYHEIITDWQREFQTKIGKNNASYFDKNGWLYFTKERFDLLYPSYGDTYPMYMGAIGMTFEQAGHGRGGLGIITDEGVELSLKDRVAHHTTTGLSTVEVASQNVEQLNTQFKNFFDTSSLKNRSYVLRGNPDKIAAVADLLKRHEIKYGFSSKGKSTGYNYSTNKSGSFETTSADLVVSVDQPKGKMVKVLFEPDAMLSDSLTYDITAWSLPYAYGLDGIQSEKIIGTQTTTVNSVINSENKSSTAYILNWTSLNDGKFLAELVNSDFRVRFTEKPFSSDGVAFNRGSLIITRGDNKKIEDFDSKLVSIANAHNRTLHAATSGFATAGPDFGSPDIKLINKQKVAMLSGKYTSSLSYGALWHFFEQQLKYPVTSINTDDLDDVDLGKYNVLIMPNGYYGGLMKEPIMEKIKDFVKGGGKLVAIDGALNSFVDKEGFNLKNKKKPETDEDKKDSTKNLVPYADREREYAKNLITGAIFKTKLDNTHPMAFGYPDYYFTLKLGNDSYSLLDRGYNVGYLAEGAKSVSGFTGSEAIKNLGETVVFGEERMGSGSFIYFVDDVLFRSFWENGKLFLVNSIFFVNNNAFEL